MSLWVLPIINIYTFVIHIKYTGTNIIICSLAIQSCQAGTIFSWYTLWLQCHHVQLLLSNVWNKAFIFLPYFLVWDMMCHFQFVVSSQVCVSKMTHRYTQTAFILLYNTPPQLAYFISYLEYLAAYLEQLPFKCLCITVIISSLRKEKAIQLTFSLWLADTRLLIGTRPVLSCTYLQFPRLIPFYCSNASITGKANSMCLLSYTDHH